jgi:DNA-binding NarL/FixJ family response regulator
VDRLTAREREVLQLIAEGHTARAIGERLVISPKTVEGHKTRIMTKLGARHRTDLLRFALRAGLVQLDEGARAV